MQSPAEPSTESSQRLLSEGLLPATDLFGRSGWWEQHVPSDDPEDVLRNLREPRRHDVGFTDCPMSVFG